MSIKNTGIPWQQIKGAKTRVKLFGYLNERGERINEAAGEYVSIPYSRIFSELFNEYKTSTCTESSASSNSHTHTS